MVCAQISRFKTMLAQNTGYPLSGMKKAAQIAVTRLLC